MNLGVGNNFCEADDAKRAGEPDPMLQRAFPIQHPYTALDEKRGADGPSIVRRLVRAFSGHLLRLLRLLGRFAAAGGPLS